MSSLYELTGNYEYLLQLIEDGGEGLEDTLEAIDDAIEIKAENYAKIINELKGNVEAIKKERARLASKAETYNNTIERLKTNLEESMLKIEKTKFKTELFSFGIQKNPKSVIIEDEMQIPVRYLIESEPKVDKKAILNDLKEGIEIKGCQLQQTQSLRIR